MNKRDKCFTRCGKCALKCHPCRNCKAEAKTIDEWTARELAKERSKKKAK